MRRFGPSFAVLAIALLAACERPPPNTWQGYFEGEFVLLASPYAGQLQTLYVQRGDSVESGNPVFALEQENERAARLESGERLKSAQARLENLEVARRAPEIEALSAQVTQASSARDLSASQLARQEQLFKSGYVAKSSVDEARMAHERDIARVDETEAQLRNARQPLGREAEREAAEAEVAAARAALSQAVWRLGQKSIAAPVSGAVQDTFFVEGEWVPAGRPVVSLLPPGNVKARFYVQESILGSLALGQAVEIRCDGCDGPVSARITYISKQAEYTPPVLYSKESRAKLQFLIEARPESPHSANLHPGQPVDIVLK